MKQIYPLALVVATGALLIVCTPLHASDTDDRIESSVKKSYVFKTYLKDDSIKTESKQGVVTLTGTVSESSHKSLAQDTVEGLPGVQSVNNQLTVRGESSKGESSKEHSDGWVGLKVKTALLFHRNVRATKTDVNVKDGIVTLSGEAVNSAQKELTGEYAADVEGVKAVNNEMTVASSAVQPEETIGERIDDASITAQVKASLLSHHSTSALKTKVTTTDGAVTVGGIAKNAAEKSLVSKIVTDVNGVTSVINNMTIAVPLANN